MNLAVRLVAICATAGTLVAGTSAAASAADLNVNSPERVVVNQSYEWVSWRIGGPKVWKLGDAFVNLEHAASRASVDFDWADDTLSGRFKVYDWNVKPGRHKVWLENAVDEDYNPMTAKADYITIKFGSRASLRTSRDGRRVTLRTRATRWNDTWSEWRAFPNKVVSFRRKTPAGWKVVARDTTNRRGIAQVTVRRGPRAKYRAVVLETRGVWGSRSAVRRR